jgi:hypothetical protein
MKKIVRNKRMLGTVPRRLLLKRASLLKGLKIIYVLVKSLSAG